MESYLKGNYHVSASVQPATGITAAEALEQEFYRRSFEKLGGSIAFILKSKNLLWTGERDSATDGTAGR